MYVCICEGVTDKQIKTAIEDGATSMRELRKELGVANECGQCGRCAKKLLKEHGPKKCARIKLPTQIPSPVPAGSFPIFGEAILAAE